MRVGSTVRPCSMVAAVIRIAIPSSGRVGGPGERASGILIMAEEWQRACVYRTRDMAADPYDGVGRLLRVEPLLAVQADRVVEGDRPTLATPSGPGAVRTSSLIRMSVIIAPQEVVPVCRYPAHRIRARRRGRFVNLG